MGANPENDFGILVLQLIESSMWKALGNVGLTIVFTSSLVVSCFGERFEAEDAVYQGPALGTVHSGYSGMGYLDFSSNIGDFVEWTIEIGEEGDYALSFGYSLGAGLSRPLELKVDGVVVEASFEFLPTGSWGDYGVSALSSLHLAVGSHTVTLTATENQGSNLDYLDVLMATTAPNYEISDLDCLELRFVENGKAMFSWQGPNGMVPGEDFYLLYSNGLKDWSNLSASDFAITNQSLIEGDLAAWSIEFDAPEEMCFVRASDESLFEPLFNGVDFTGWSVVSGSESMYQVIPSSEGEPFYIEGEADGSLGMLATDEIYSDFEVQYEFWVDDPLNSGVQMRSYLVSGAVTGYQIEIDPSTRAWSGGLYEQRGRGWLNDLSENEPARLAFLAGTWNHMRVVMDGDRVQSWINGVPATDYEESSISIPREGFLAIQVHQGSSTIFGKKIRIRNMILKRL